MLNDDKIQYLNYIPVASDAAARNQKRVAANLPPAGGLGVGGASGGGPNWSLLTTAAAWLLVANPNRCRLIACTLGLSRQVPYAKIRPRVMRPRAPAGSTGGSSQLLLLLG